MTDTEKHKEADSTALLPDSEPTEAPLVTRASWSMRWLVCLLLLSVVALSFAAAWLWEGQIEAGRQVAALNLRLDAVAELQSAMDEQKSVQQKMTAMMTQQTESIETLDALVAPLARRQLRTASTALITELNYLLRTASLALTLSKDIDLASQLLREAADLAGQENLPGLAELKQALVEDQALLVNHQGLDISATYLALASLSRWIADQPVLTMAEQIRSKGIALQLEDNASLSPPEDTWQGTMTRLVDRLSGLVDFRKNQPPIRIDLTQQDAARLLQNQLLLIKTAQLALLQRDPVVFEASLVQFKADAERYYDLSQNESAVITMARLASIKIDVDPPSLDASLSAFERFRATLENRDL